MSTKRTEKEEVEEPVKKGPLLIISLVLLLFFLLITGFLLIRWYLEMMEQVEAVNSGRVLISGVAVLILIIFTILGLVNVLRGKKQKSRKPSVAKRKTSNRATSSVTRKKTRKTT